VTGPSILLSRLYLLLAGLAVLLGMVTIVAHLRQPSVPAFPGSGCIVTAFPGPDTLHSPSPYLQLRACSHISETTFALDLYSAHDAPPIGLFEASGPEDPRRWAQYLSVRWLASDTVEVGYDPDIRFLTRLGGSGGVQVRYVPLRRAGVSLSPDR
jgi:hypothetical protein